jgi:hypothetical protein
MRVTRHAAKRTRSRLGLPKRSVTKNAESALHYGLTHKETAGSLNRYITGLYLKHKTANNIRIYCDTVYIFQNERLITLFPLPQKYKKTAKALTEKRKEE